MAIASLSRLGRLTAPTFKLSVEGLPSGSEVSDRLVSISVTLNNGQVSDQLSLEFDDRDTVFGGGISLPKQGVEISVSLGYETYTAQMGTFIVNRISSSGSSAGRTLSVIATPALLNADYTRTWSNNSIADIVDTIAGEHKLKARVSQKLQSETITVVNQFNESNAAFLDRLAARYNAVCKPMAGNLLFMVKGEGTSASGLPMPPVTVSAHDVLQWSKNFNQQLDVKKVCASWIDYARAEMQEIYVPFGVPKAGENVLRLPHPFNNEREAKAPAVARFDETNREDESLSLTMIGNPEITAEGRISLTNFRTSVNGSYIVKSAAHSFNQGGYQTTLSAYVEPE